MKKNVKYLNIVKTNLFSNFFIEDSSTLSKNSNLSLLAAPDLLSSPLVYLFSKSSNKLQNKRLK